MAESRKRESFGKFPKSVGHKGNTFSVALVEKQERADAVGVVLLLASAELAKNGSWPKS